MRVGERGFSLIDVMLAMTILSFVLLGAMGTVQWADLGQQTGAVGTRALALAEARLEAKRVATWETLLVDDVTGDGIPDVTLNDAGQEGDEVAGDGIYTATTSDHGIHVFWSVQALPAGPLRHAGAVLIEAKAVYPVGPSRSRELTIGTLRANPRYSGPEGRES
jgi:type II secretory pathway pseudopilin PulG